MPRTEPATEGKTFTRTCAWCGKKFTSDNARTKYCTLACKKAHGNHTYYQVHAEDVSAKNNERQKKQRERLKELESISKSE